MQSTATGYKLIKKIRDDRFDEENIHHYDLYVQLSIRDLQVAIADGSDNRILFFEDYVLGDLNSHDELLQLLQSIFESHPLLQAGFWKSVKVSIKNNKFVQVPESLFVSEATNEYLGFNATFDPDKESILYCKNHDLSVITVFAVQKDLINWLNKIYQNTQVAIFHQSSALIEGVMQYAAGDGNNTLYVYVDRFKLHILSIKNKKLIYYNQFVIKQFSDYVKYIMLVMKGLGLNQEASEVVLWGYIGKSSPHYQEFIKYIRNVKFGTRLADLKFGYIFDELQDHHFFDLFSVTELKP